MLKRIRRMHWGFAPTPVDLRDWLTGEVRVHLPGVALWFRRVRNDRRDGPRFRHWQD